VKVVAVDATQSEKLAQKYQIQGFPTLKIFGSDKSSPVEYQGARDANGIVTECMKAANQLVKDRKAGKTKASSSGGEKKKEKKEKKENASIELNEANFGALVMERY
jgi:protein disulfide-isomerase A6